MKKFYYCRECSEIFSESEKISGVTYAADNYTSDSCSACGSEDIIEINGDDICPICHKYHDEDSDLELAYCFKGIYSDARGQLYIMAHWKMMEFYRTMAELSDEGRSDTIQTIIWDSLVENGEVMKFLRFVCDYDDARGDINRDRRFMAGLDVSAESGGKYGEWIDTNEVAVVKEAV